MRTAKPLPDLARLHEALEYHEEGYFTWKSRPLHHFPDLRAMRIWNTRYAGKKAIGGALRNGYRNITFDNKIYSAHRLTWHFHMGDCPSHMEVDHKNCIRDDNRIENLRLATPNNNQHNRLLQKNNTSGHKNVLWNKQCGKWMVQMNYKRQEYYFGLFDNLEEAAECAKNARDSLHKEFSNHGVANLER